MASLDRVPRTATRRVVGAYAAGAVLMGIANVLALAYLEGRYPGVATGYLRTCVGSLIAGLQEPLTSKLLPALAVLATVSEPEEALALRRHRWRLAGIGGLTVGGVEFLSKLIEGQPIVLELVGPITIHLLTGLLVGVALFRTAGRRRSLIDAHVVLLALGLAILLHVGWNRYLGFWLAGPNPC